MTMSEGLRLLFIDTACNHIIIKADGMKALHLLRSEEEAKQMSGSEIGDSLQVRATRFSSMSTYCGQNAERSARLEHQASRINRY
jgi:hypothetical protein